MSGLAGRGVLLDIAQMRPRPRHLLGLLALAACFPYVPTPTPTVAPGAKVVVAHDSGFVLRQPPRERERIAPGCRVTSVEGTMGPQSADTLWFATVLRREATVETADCLFPATAYVVLADAPALQPRVQQFDRGRTVMLALALPTLIGVIAGVLTP
jgi:hypothetical protein